MEADGGGDGNGDVGMEIFTDYQNSKHEELI